MDNDLDQSQGEERDPETYDDNEFYQALLKEFLEGKQAGGVNWYTVGDEVFILDLFHALTSEIFASSSLLEPSVEARL